MRPGYLMHRFTQRLFGDRPPPESAATDGAENAKYLVASGGGYTILPNFSVAGDPLETAGVLTARRISGVDTPVTMLALRRAEGRRSRAVDEFVGVLRGLAAEHPQGFATNRNGST